MTGVLILYHGEYLESRIQELGDTLVNALMEKTRVGKDGSKTVVTLKRYAFPTSEIQQEFEKWLAEKEAKAKEKSIEKPKKAEEKSKA